MERKIGEIFNYDGEWYQCAGGTCRSCSFYYDTACKNIDTIGKTVIGNCHCSLREDHKNVIFKKLEKVGEPVTVKGRTFQKLTSDNNSCKECVFNVPNKACCKNNYIEGICDDNGFWIEIKQNKEDMEENNNAKHSNTENIGENLKAFDLQAAKSGKPVCTRDGKKARIICFDAKDNLPIIALITNARGDESLARYKSNGRFINLNESDYDLMMLPEKKEGWVNLYRDEESKRVYCGEFIFSEREKAEKHYKCNDPKVATVPVRWEE